MNLGRSCLIAIGAVSLGGASAIAENGPAMAGASEYVEIPGVKEFSGQMIVRPVQIADWEREGLSPAAAAERMRVARVIVADLEVLHYVWQTDEYIVRVPGGMTENDLANRLLPSGVFQYVEPDYIVFPLDCPDDSQLGSQWHHNADRMQSCDGWDIHTGNPSVSVAICDTGIRTTHEDFQLHRLEGYNSVDQLWESQGGQIVDINGHGTATSGCAAANGDNGVGIAGVGWDLSHRMVRVSNYTSGGSTYSWIQHGARTAVEAGDRVASVSYSGVDASSNLTTATYIKSIGGLLVWAAGNEGRNLTLNDRDADDIIVVGATDENDVKTGWSNYGIFVDVTAPGNNVYTASYSSDSSYGPASGTSFSCPLTAGLCGLLFSSNPALTPDEVEDLLKNGVDDLGSSGIDDTYGYGRINVFGSLSLVGTPFTLDVDPLIAGSDATLRVNGATPNGEVYFVYSLTGLGSTFVPALNVTLDLDRPRLGGSATADGTGFADISTTIPPAGAGLNVWIQAAEIDNTTNVVATTIN
ncbi:MAG: S8 family serine peptidase [Phycisphaerales bacterium]